MTPDEMREAAERIAAFTRGNDPNPGGRFASGSYRTPDEARERGEAWVARPGEPQDLRNEFHYQTPDEWRGAGRSAATWGAQPAVMQGRATHAGWQGGRPAIDPGMATLGAMTGLAPVSRQMPREYTPLSAQPSGMPGTTLGEWLQMTSRNAPDWRYLSGR